jgi:hypothetical protein
VLTYGDIVASIGTMMAITPQNAINKITKHKSVISEAGDKTPRRQIPVRALRI